MSAALFVVFTLTAFPRINADICWANLCPFRDRIEKTEGEVWPKPMIQRRSDDDFFFLSPAEFRFENTGAAENCDILENASKRYFSMIFDPSRLTTRKTNFKQHSPFLKKMYVRLSNDCDNQWPNADMNEQYDLIIDTDSESGKRGEALLAAKYIWGILRGLETFSQLVRRTNDGLLVINTTRIYDYPRFPHRGLLLDTSRHFLPKKIIFETLEAMAQNKFNVFHWHIVDHQSFPYVSRVFPQMSEIGAYDPQTHTYNLTDITDIIMFARDRGIRVIPEFDTPHHAQSWGLSIPRLLTPCYSTLDDDEVVLDWYGAINPTVESTYEFLEKFLLEVSTTFPEKYIHLGGIREEVFFYCWRTNPHVADFMARKGFDKWDFDRLERYYMKRLQDIVKSFPQNKSYIIWHDMLEDDKRREVNPDTIVQVRKILRPNFSFENELAKVTREGYRALLSACWYLDEINYRKDWEFFYACDPQKFPGSEDQKKLVLGGEAVMWGEYVDENNLTPQLWPRASAVAERLWSGKDVNSVDNALPRLEEHRCRMVCRGIHAEPANGPGFCRC